MEHDITLFEAFKLFWKKAFVFRGRARRKEYWGAALFNIIISLVLSIFGSFINSSVNVPTEQVFKPGDSLTNLYGLICLIPQFTLMARRLQDINLPGILSVIPSFLTTIIGIIAGVLLAIDIEKNLTIGLVLLLIVLVIGILFFVFTVLDGTKGPNKYGEDPKGRMPMHQ